MDIRTEFWQILKIGLHITRVTQKVFRYTSIKYYNWNVTITFSQSILPQYLCNVASSWTTTWSTVAVIQCTELPLVCCNRVFKYWKPLPTQSVLHRREQKEVTRVPGLHCKEDGTTAAQESPSENHSSNGWHGQRRCHGATGCPSVQLLGAFLEIFGEPVGGQLWCTTVQYIPLMLKWYCCHLTTCSKESEHHFLPNTFCSFHFERSIIIREHSDRRVTLCFWITLVNPDLVTCNDLRIVEIVLIVESPKHFTATFPLEWPSDRQWDCGTQRDGTLLTLR